MIKEYLVSFKTAKLLKNINFDSPVYDYYMGSEKIFRWEEPTNGNDNSFTKEIYSAPTQELVKIWFMEIFKINIRIDFLPNVKKWGFIVYPLNFNGKEYITYARKFDFTYEYRKIYFSSYEKTFNFAIQYLCLLYPKINFDNILDFPILTEEEIEEIL